MTAAYAPARDPASKLRRRLTQWRAARPIDLRFDTPMLSISFDDFPVSAATTGAAMLEAHGARGTFYASAGLAGVEGPSGLNFSADDLRRLAAAGHEIGCHTHAHADCARRSVFDTLQDLAQNRDGLRAMGLNKPTRTIAYPYGETSAALKANLPPRFESARGILPGLNIGRTDIAQLRAYALFDANGVDRLHNALKRAAKRKAWVIGFTHDVADAPSAFGTSTADLDQILRTARQLDYTILPVSAALARRLS